MRSSLFFISALASVVSALPAPPAPPSAPQAGRPAAFPSLPLGLLQLIPKYLANPPPGSCDISKVQLPSSTLPPPDAGLTLSLVALGRGTQNYTCASSTSADKPVAAGALANMFNASCVAAHASSSDLGKYTSLKEKSPKDANSQYPLPLVGEHYFTDLTTPAFFLNVLGVTQLKKNASVPAVNATTDVAWLKLLTQSTGTTSKVGNVYRVNTVNGQPPATCDGLKSTFTVEYAADYYFYSSS